MMSSTAPRLAARLSFLVPGFVVACWAPLIPFAKSRLGIDDGALGLLLLHVGVGSVAGRMASGPLSAKIGSKPIILCCGFLLAAFLPLLAMAETPGMLGVLLFAFGVTLGAIDVAMNVQAAEIECAAGEPLMSGFHAMFSIGAFTGAGSMTTLLSWHVSPIDSALVCVMPIVAALIVAWPRLISASRRDSVSRVATPRGVVVVLCCLAAVTFLSENAMLDWSALLMTDQGLFNAASAGLAYMLFSLAMTAGRLSGDKIARNMGDAALLFWGAIVALAGYVAMLMSVTGWTALIGCVLIGLGSSNIAPVLFRKAGAQRAMPAPLAIGVLATIGHACALAGPAGIGAISQRMGLEAAFWMLATLFCLVPLVAPFLRRLSKEEET